MSGNDDIQIVTFGLGDEVFAVPVMLVREILDYAPAFRVPNGPEWLLGLTDVRGQGVPTIDLRTRLGLASVEPTPTTRILIVDIPLDGRTLSLGVVVDRVMNVSTFARNSLEPAPDIGMRWHSDYIEAVVRQPDGFVVMINIGRLFSDDETTAAATDRTSRMTNHIHSYPAGFVGRAIIRLAIGGMAIAVPGAALAQATAGPPDSAAERDYGPSRPGLGTPASTMAQGRLSVETAFGEWERDRNSGMRTDTVDVGSTTLRLGVSNSTEVLASWTPFEHVRSRNTVAGTVDRASGVGDVMLGVKQNIRNPDGSGLSFAVLPYVVLPVGSAQVSAGDWAAGIVLPVSYDLSDTISLQVTPQFDAATDGDGNGRHFAYSVIAGVGVQLTEAVGVTGELATQRDNDPDGRSTQVLGSLSVAWMVNDDLQLDIGGTVGLNQATPDHTLYAGISRRF